jgi:hypothetical protein
MGERDEGREVPTPARVSTADLDWGTGRPSIGRLGESLSYPPSVVGLDERRLSMVLELYCRKAERKREGRKERQREIEREERLERKRD